MITDPNVESLKIPHDFISIFASGFSVDKITPEDYNEIKRKTFVIGTNYFFLKFLPHMLFWSDIRITKLIHDTFPITPGFLLMTRSDAYERGEEVVEEKLKVDYWFNKLYYNLEGNFTFFFVLQLMKKFFPDRPILTFGLDFYIPPEEKEKNILKYYDKMTDYDINTRNHDKYADETLPKFRKWMLSWIGKDPSRADNIFNCNSDSNLNLFIKKDWREILNASINTS